MSENSSSSRVTRWVLRDDADRAHWDVWAEAVQTARHPALARVVDCERDDDTGTLTLLDPESEDIATWADRTGASVPERLAVLRAAAAALDALYGGTGSEGGIAHGGVSPAAIRVDADGATRLVGFSPWAGHDDAGGRFLAPELASGKPATRAGDVYAFARVVAEVLGGPGVAATEDAGAISRALRANPDTRRRARLIRAVHSALTSPAEARPQPLGAWLAAAVEGTAVTEIGANLRPPTEESIVESPPGRHRWGLAVVVLVAVAAGLVGWLLRPGTGRPSNPTASGDGPQVTLHAAWAAPCGGDSLAGTGDPDALHRPSAADDLAQLPGLSVGRLQRGRLLITMRANDANTPIQVDKIEAYRVQPVSSPAWAEQLSSTCAARSAADRRYSANLDTEAPSTVVDPGDPGRFGPKSADGFAVRSTPTVIEIDVVACDQSYEWQPKVYYTIGSKSRVWSPRSFFFVYGTASGATRYALQDSGALPQVVDTIPADPACGSRG